MLIGIFTICIVPAFLASIFRSKDTTYIENQAKIESDKHAYHVLMAGASRNFSNGYYEYSKSDILRAHKIYPNRLAPMYMLTVIYSEDCVKKNYNCDKYQSFKTVVLSRTKDDKDWKEQRLFLLKEYDEI